MSSYLTVTHHHLVPFCTKWSVKRLSCSDRKLKRNCWCYKPSFPLKGTRRSQWSPLVSNDNSLSINFHFFISSCLHYTHMPSCTIIMLLTRYDMMLWNFTYQLLLNINYCFCITYHTCGTFWSFSIPDLCFHLFQLFDIDGQQCLSFGPWVCCSNHFASWPKYSHC